MIPLKISILLKLHNLQDITYKIMLKNVWKSNMNLNKIKRKFKLSQNKDS